MYLVMVGVPHPWCSSPRRWQQLEEKNKWQAATRRVIEAPTANGERRFYSWIQRLSSTGKRGFSMMQNRTNAFIDPNEAE
jgi:hypothetical protein